mmetsp:Transcript_27674/g.75427  ORF Transcript_27674/g.75427 Transcript_27674/m.75427 type:complete len:555 (-) Transcript_27674:1995-3659(-)|eukprot:CAMPEP_0172360104 /NCGR_PEP_ID=MMETSP1060-20121228/4188_1 /TAXON_ID=37318 /ORGANISM="Pseudo-nitzschia pungens, Strain cf. cingulata" /LENGTH=554 /DNA_ID=CAMNT_0013082001 /DNA_START=361 /DNA_END=2025 /DNA_ORIENTATION=+
MTKQQHSPGTRFEESSSDSEYHRANEEIEYILGATAPKHIGEGISSGLGYILRGAVGACGAIVLLPTLAGAEGRKELGVVGGIAGASGGIVAGVVQGVNVLGGGIVTGFSQIARGVTATPTALIAPSKGYWWNGALGKWVQTSLLEEERWIQTQPVGDEDLLGPIVTSDDESSCRSAKTVKDMYFYDKLNLDCDVDTDTIQRRYFVVARKYAPTRCGANPKAAAEFREIQQAHSILTNPILREKYDRVGRAHLWDEDDSDDESEDEVDPRMLYTLLFGSEKFHDHIGALAKATSSARTGNEVETNLTLGEMRLLQKRRATRLALRLAERLSVWAEDNDQERARKKWEEEALFLCDASYGDRLVQVIGKVYTFAAIHFRGSMKSGLGMPSVSRWAKKQHNKMQLGSKNAIETTLNLGGSVEHRELHLQVSTAIEKSAGDEELEEVAMNALKKSYLRQIAVELLWQQTVVDITSTVREACQMVLNDLSVAPEVRKARAKGLEVLGGIFEAAKRSDSEPRSHNEQELERIAFHAMLDTVWRQEVAATKRKRSDMLFY